MPGATHLVDAGTRVTKAGPWSISKIQPFFPAFLILGIMPPLLAFCAPPPPQHDLFVTASAPKTVTKLQKSAQEKGRGLATWEPAFAPTTSETLPLRASVSPPAQGVSWIQESLKPLLAPARVTISGSKISPPLAAASDFLPGGRARASCYSSALSCSREGEGHGSRPSKAAYLTSASRANP